MAGESLVTSLPHLRRCCSHRNRSFTCSPTTHYRLHVAWHVNGAYGFKLINDATMCNRLVMQV